MTNGLYKEMPEILKAGNLLERFTKVVKGERIVDYEKSRINFRCTFKR